MTPEALAHLEKARQLLRRARIILGTGITEDAGRDAYLAAFHGAQALIAERTGRESKTHRGTHARFARLTKDEPRIDAELRRFPPQAYDLKAISDYETGSAALVPLGEAAAALETAERFIERIAELLALPADEPP
jgi:uncharacterized protein (UPF0332 family)